MEMTTEPTPRKTPMKPKDTQTSVLKKHGNFIYEFSNILSPEFCKNAITKFEGDRRKVPGRSYTGLSDTKKSTDLYFTTMPEWENEDKVLQKSAGEAVQRVIELHPLFGSMPLMDRGYQMQRTKVGEYFKPHYDSGDPGSVHRQLVLLWYLNDVKEGGQTRFNEFGIEATPKQGTLLVFPPFWTHIHEGVPPISNTKYVITTWIELSAQELLENVK